MYKLRPFIFENSRIPAWLSKISPINVEALSFGWFVFCKGEASERLRQHETIHFFQQLELLFVFQWILYGLFSCYGRLKHGSWVKAYYRNPFEREAYSHESDSEYFQNRSLWAWTKHLGDKD